MMSIRQAQMCSRLSTEAVFGVRPPARNSGPAALRRRRWASGFCACHPGEGEREVEATESNRSLDFSDYDYLSQQDIGDESDVTAAEFTRYTQAKFYTSESSLANIVNAEIINSAATGSRSDPEILDEGPPRPFELITEPDSCELVCSRAYKNETVNVTVFANDEETQVINSLERDSSQWMEDDEDRGQSEATSLRSQTIFFHVQVGKRESLERLTFVCVTNGTAVEILRVSLEAEGGTCDADTAEDRVMYTGPNDMDTMSPELLDSFNTYLVDRGVTSELTEYLKHLVNHSKHREHIKWLERLNDFLEE